MGYGDTSRRFSARVFSNRVWAVAVFAATVFLSPIAIADDLHKKSCKEILSATGGLSPEQAQGLKARFGLEPSDVTFSPKMKIPVILRMSGHETLAPHAPKNITPVRELKKYDVTIVGGGPAGLVAALYLAKAGFSVLILERNSELGGLGMGSRLGGIEAAAGSAYFTNPAADAKMAGEVLAQIGFPREKIEQMAITEAIDSLLWKGELYEGVWEEKTLEKLPASFAVFKHALQYWERKGAGETEGPVARYADRMAMAEFVRQMPAMLAARSAQDPVASQILSRFHLDKDCRGREPMGHVIALLNQYGRSALGGLAKHINARQFTDFYSAELGTRYTGTMGSGTITASLLDQLKKFPNVEMRASTPVAKIENRSDSTRITFVENGTLKEVVSRRTVFAAPMALAPKLIQNLETLDPEKVETIKAAPMTDYAVHVVRVKGHPYRASYDTWVIPDDIEKEDPEKEPSDYILGRWQDSKIQGYIGYRDFSKDPDDDYGVITIYDPQGLSKPGRFSKENSLVLVERAVAAMHKRLGPLAAKYGQKIEIEVIESYRYPYAIHRSGPHSLERLPILARPTGRILYANNTMGQPEIEQALIVGAEAAHTITSQEQPAAQPQSK